MSSIARFTLCFCLLLLGHHLPLNSQGSPSCDASSISLLSVQPTTDGILASFTLQEQADVASYTLQYAYSLSGTPMEEILEVSPPLFEITLASDTGIHHFTILNNCIEGDLHLGSQLQLDMSDSDFACPVPSNLQILDYNENNLSFQWAFNELALSWHVQYDNAEGFVEAFDVIEPFVFQELSRSAYHIFTIYAECEDQALSTTQFIRRSPAIQFMIITVDDIKALSISCMELCTLTERAYLLTCTRHGKFEANKTEFLSKHECGCLTSIKERVSIFENITYYPSPTSDKVQINFQLKQKGKLGLELFNSSGKRIQNLQTPTFFSSGSHQLAYDLSALPTGVYWLKLSANRQFQHLKILINR